MPVISGRLQLSVLYNGMAALLNLSRKKYKRAPTCSRVYVQKYTSCNINCYNIKLYKTQILVGSLIMSFKLSFKIYNIFAILHICSSLLLVYPKETHTAMVFCECHT